MVSLTIIRLFKVEKFVCVTVSQCLWDLSFGSPKLQLLYTYGFNMMKEEC